MIDTSYKENIKDIKAILTNREYIYNYGYCIVKNQSWKELSEKIFFIISKIIFNYIGKKSKITSNNIEQTALEGILKEVKYLSYSRNADIVRRRKEQDNYTCQICKFQKTVNNKNIIECHHLTPIGSGIRITNIEDLISLCPTCHRIVHAKKPAYSIDELKKL